MESEIHWHFHPTHHHNISHLNVGTRMRCLNESEVRKAFQLASEEGSVLMRFTNHDFRDIQPGIELVQNMISNVRSEFPDVKLKFSDVREAFNRVIFGNYNPPEKIYSHVPLNSPGLRDIGN